MLEEFNVLIKEYTVQNDPKEIRSVKPFVNGPDTYQLILNWNQNQ